MPRVKSFKVRKGTEINGYRVDECLGRGWEGEVYRVTEEFSRAPRVLKLFDPHQYRSKHMFEYCPKLEKLSSVSAVIRYYNGGWWERYDCYYLVMESVDGMPLDRLVSRRWLPLFRALRIVRDLLRIVRDCHDLNCCVGDIHSGNIILSAPERPCIIDVDLGSKFTRQTSATDRVAICKLLYELTDVPQTFDLRQTIPKRANAIAAKYKSTSEALRAVDSLLGRETHQRA
jgi:serine/threonine protein kinase